jgi:hypothetical protein
MWSQKGWKRGIVNLIPIAELLPLNSVGKWGTDPNFAEGTAPEWSEMWIQWGKLIKRIF